MTIFTFPAIQVSTAGLATEAEQQAQTALLTTIDSKTPNLGQALMAGSVPVVIASNQSAVPVSGPLTDTQLRATAVPVSGPLTDAQLRATAVPVSGPLTDTQLRATAVPVSGPLTDTQLRASAVPVSAAALPLPTGAATETTLQSIDAGIPAALGQTTMSASMPVTIASNQSAVPSSQSGTWTVQPGNTANTTAWLVTQAGRSKANAPLYNDYTSTAVTTSAYVQLVASTTSAANRIEIFDSSGEALFLAVGGSGSEVDQLLIYPGGNGIVDIAIPASSRISIKAKTATASNGFIIVNLYT